MRGVRLQYVDLLELKDPVETATAKFDALVDLTARLEELVGTVAAKVHWILFPVTLPFTEFTFSCGAKRKRQ